MKTINKRALAAILVVLSLLLTSLSAAALTAGDAINDASISTLDDNDYTVVYEGNMSKKEYAFSPSICVIENGSHKGRIVVSWDVNSTTKNIPPSASIGSVGHIAYSDNGGRTFTNATIASDNFLFATVFEAGNALYLMARQSTTRYLVICKSTDGGATWGAFTTIDSTRTWHTSPSGAYYRNGQVFLIWENGASGRGSLSPVLWWANETANLASASSWSHSNFDFPYSNRVGNNAGNGQLGTYINTDYLGVPFWGGVTNNLGWLEASVTEIKDPDSDLYDPTGNTLYGYLRSTLATSSYGALMKFVYNSSTGLWVPMDVQSPSGEKMLFTQLPGGNNKFHLTVDEQTGIQWLLSSVNSDSMNPVPLGDDQRMNDPANERKDLGLYYSSDGLNWTFAGYVSRGAQEIQSRNYASLYIYGNDMYVLSRTGNQNAASFHNNNLITLHVVKNFRNLTVSDSVASKTAGVVLSANALGNSAVDNTEVFVDSTGREWVTCTTSNGSTVFLKNENGGYTQSLHSDFLLGEVAQINGRLYVFGCDDTRLVAYQYTENAGWGNFMLVREGNFAGAPSDVYQTDRKVFVAVDEYDDSKKPVSASNDVWSSLRGYSGNTSSVADSGTTATLTGYGAATYSKGISMEEGDSVSVTLSGMSLAASTENQIDLLFLDQGNSFFNNTNDAGNGLRVNLTSWSSLNGFRLKYCAITAGQKGTETAFSQQITSALATSTITYTLTKKAQTINAVDYTFVLSVKVTNSNGNVTNGEQSVNIPASLLAANAFKNGVYLATGNQYVSTAAQSNVYTVSHPVKYAGKWAVWQGSLEAETQTDSAVVNAASATGAASLSKSISLQEGKSVSTKVIFNLSGNTANTAVGVAFTSKQNMYYGWNDSTGYALGVQFSNLNGVQYFYCNNGTKNFSNISGTIGFNKAAEDLTYTISLTDNGNSGYTLWVKLNNTVYAAAIPTSQIPAHALTGNVYLNTGNRAKLTAGTYTVNNHRPTAGEAAGIGEKDAYYTYPVVLRTFIESFNPSTSAWAILSGVSFAEKIGDPSEAKLGLFGLPYDTVDPLTVGWKDAKIFTLNSSDATDFRYRSYEAVNNGEGVGLTYRNYDSSNNHLGMVMVLPVKNLGKNYAAMFMVDKTINTFVVPSGEEMVLIRVPGGNYSFDITYDSVSSTYWLATTEDTDSGNTRVSLYYSYNAYDWLYAGALAEGLTGDAHVSMAINGSTMTVTANINGIKAYRVPLFRSLTGENRDLANWENTRGYTNSTLVMSNGDASFSGIGGARISSRIDMTEGTSLSFAVGTTSSNWTAGGKFTVGLVNANNSFVGSANDTGSGFILDIINNASVSANMYLYTVANGTASGSGANAANKLNTLTFTEAQITGDGMQIVFTRHTHKDAQGNDCAWIISVLQNNNTVLQKSIPVSQVAANLFNNGAYFIAGARYNLATNYTISDMTAYSLYQGDINADFAFNATDLVVLRKGLLQSESGMVYDLTGDGNADVRDLVRIKKMLASVS